MKKNLFLKCICFSFIGLLLFSVADISRVQAQVGSDAGVTGGGAAPKPATVTPSDASNPATYNPPANSNVVGNGNLPNYVPLEPIPGLNQTGNANFGQLLSQLFKVLIIIGALIAVGAFVYAGISYMFSSVPGIKLEARGRLTSALGGLLLLIGAWVILFTINPQLVTFSGGLNPIASNYQLITSGSGNCVGQICLTQQQIQNANTVSQNALNPQPLTEQQVADHQAVQTAEDAQCTAQKGSIVPDCSIMKYPNLKNPATGNPYSSCSNITVGATSITCAK